VTGIDPSSPVPLYYQLKLLLREQIDQGYLKPGDKIPTEAELCAQYAISRTPVRQAVLELAREGLLTRTVGRGTFVAPRREELIALQVTVPDERWQWPLEEAMRLWNAGRPGSRVTLSFQTVPLDELRDQLSLDVARGEAPDISVLDSVWVAEFAHRRYLCPPADIDAAWVAELRDEIYPSLLRANSFQGQLYAVPTNADAAVLWYRRDWLEAEGIPPPTTWRELAAAAAHFARPQIQTRYGTAAHPLIFCAGRAAGETTTYQMLPFLWSNGGDILDGNHVVLDSAANRQVLAFLRDLVLPKELAPPDVTTLPWDGAWRAFARSEVALALGGTYENFLIQSAAGWDSATFARRVGFVPVPAGPQGTQATLVGGMTYGIYRQTAHAKEALALLKFALSAPILQPFSLQTAQNPASRAVADAIAPDKESFLARTAQLFADGGSRPSLAAYPLVSAQFGEMLELCLSGELSVERALRRAAERIGGITAYPVHPFP
jgi:ABC-type glycerol-3-phosphate transport system substrate-binding protein